MRRQLIIFFVFLTGFAVSAMPLTGVQLYLSNQNSAGFTVHFDLSESSTEFSKSGFIPLITSFSENGSEIPVFSKLISVPDGHMASVRVIERESTSSHLQTMYFDSNPTAISDLELAELTLDPPVAVRCGKADTWRGRRVAPLAIYPVQVETTNGTVIENQSIEFEIVFEPDPTAEYITPIRDFPGNNLERMIDNLILNHETTECVGVQQAHRGRMLFLVQDYPREGDDLEFLENAVPWINRLAEWKRMMGYRVEIVTMDYDEISPQEMKEEVIRPRYQDQDDPLTYLLIFGGNDPEADIFFPSYRPDHGEEGDHYYSFFGENQYLSDIAVGRMEVSTYDQIRGAVLRSINYESDPYVDSDEFDENGGEWFERALVTVEQIIAPGGQFVPSQRHVALWTADKLEQYGYDNVDTLWSVNIDDNINPAVHEILENGTGVALSRGWLSGSYYRDWNEGDEYITPDNGRKHPFVVAIHCLSFETQQGFFQSVDRRGNNGPVASLSMKGLTHTTPSNSLLGGCVRGMVHFGLNQAGLIQMFGKYQLWSDNQFDLGELVYSSSVVLRLMGDPSVQIITENPITLEAEFPEELSLGATGLSVEVISEGEAVPDAWVSIYQEDGIHLVCQPCEDGWARFTFGQDELAEGELGVTITRYNALPVHGTVDVISDGDRVDLTEVQFDNDDDMFANGESIVAELTYTNNGNRDLEDLLVSLTTDDHHITFVDQEFEIDNLPAGESVEIQMEFEIHRSSQSGRTVRIQAVTSSGDADWESAFSFVSSGHKLSIEGNIDPNNEFSSGSEAQFIPLILNFGDLPTPVAVAVLISLSPYVTVTNEESLYEAIDGDGGNAVPADESSFTVEVDDLAINGSLANFMLTMAAEDEDDDFADTIYFSETIGEAEVTDPYGPDSYGYIMFDSGDNDWDKAPSYDWIEINPHKNRGAINGELLELGDNHVDLDSTIAVELPFTFQYYGEEFDTIAVNSNGWIAFGADKTQYVDFRNQQIPGIQGPDAMVAVFWQDLVNYLDNEESGIYYYYDAEAGIFIIEWSALRVYEDYGELIEAQIILYDQEIYLTSTEDGEIKLQYKSASRARGAHTDNQYSTVGIKNLDGTSGLEYVYWDQYPAANLPLEDEMAILVTTDRYSAMGGIEGSITREEDHEARIEGATVKALRTGMETVTDVNGEFAFESINTGRERIRIIKDGFNNLEMAVDVEEDEVSQIVGRLTHPQIEVPENEIVHGLQSGEYGVSFDFSFENRGNGPLNYHFSRRYPDGSPTEYALGWNANLSELVDDDNGLLGCQFVGDEIFVSGRSDRGNFEDERVYVFERGENSEPNLVRSFLQPNQSDNGFYDLAFDGEYLYGGEKRHYQDHWGDHDTLVIVKFDLEGEVIDEIILDIDPNNTLDLPYALAYNPRNNTLITTHGDRDIYMFSQNGELVDQISLSLPGVELAITGLAWNDYDDDDMPLYIVDQLDDSGGIRLSKANIETSEAMIVTELDGFVRDRPTGLTIGYGWDVGVLNLATIGGGAGNRTNDSLRVYEIGPDSHYLTLNPKRGIVESGQTAIIEMEMRSDGLEEGEYSHVLAITHNADGEEVFIQATLDVSDAYEVENDYGSIPTQFRLEQAFPNPFNSSTTIKFTLPQQAYTNLSIFDTEGRKVDVLVSDYQNEGFHTAVWDAKGFASGIYFYRMQTNEYTVVKKMTLIR